MLLHYTFQMGSLLPGERVRMTDTLQPREGRSAYATTGSARTRWEVVKKNREITRQMAYRHPVCRTLPQIRDKQYPPSSSSCGRRQCSSDRRGLTCSMHLEEAGPSNETVNLVTAPSHGGGWGTKPVDQKAWTRQKAWEGTRSLSDGNVPQNHQDSVSRLMTRGSPLPIHHH